MLRLDLRTIIDKLVTFYNFDIENCKVVKYSKELTCFEFLVLSILSQNTNDELAERAFWNLVNELGRPLTPATVLSAGEEVIIRCIRVSGMYKRKCETIMNLASALIKVGEDFLSKAPVEEVRNFLMNIKGLGKKTVDVFLLFKRMVPTFPVDTHIRRICVRLGLSRRGDYDEISSIFLSCYDGDWRGLAEAHLVLIMHGRTLCKALKPICNKCPLVSICCFYKERSSSSYKRL